MGENMVTVPTRKELLEVVPQGGRLAELGVFAGDFAAEMLEVCRPSELHLIDIWKDPVLCKDTNGENPRYVEDMTQLWREVQKRFEGRPEVTVHRGDSVSILGGFPKGYFDFVYVDADHRHEAVMRELQAAARVSKGLIGGHDYKLDEFPGVVLAVKRWCKAGWEMTHLTTEYFPSFVLKRTC